MRFWIAGLASLAGLFGAFGVGLAAAAAHIAGDGTLRTAAEFLLFHAAALVGLVALARPRLHRGVLLAGWMIALGVVLFSGDLALHVLAGLQPWARAAPTGGTILILGWLVAAVAAPLALRESP